MYNSIDFNTCIDMCSHHYNGGTELSYDYIQLSVVANQRGGGKEGESSDDQEELLGHKLWGSQECFHGECGRMMDSS